VFLVDSETKRKERSAGEMTEEEIGKMTIEEVVRAFAESLGKGAQLEDQHRALKLRLKHERKHNPNLTDRQREMLSEILFLCG
jgi:hypothetical protein